MDHSIRGIGLAAVAILGCNSPSNQSETAVSPPTPTNSAPTTSHSLELELPKEFQFPEFDKHILAMFYEDFDLRYDDEIDLSLSSPTVEARQAAATVAMFRRVQRNADSILLGTMKLRQRLEDTSLCGETKLHADSAARLEPFLDQIHGAHCSGVLVKSDVVASAAHCATNLKIPWTKVRFVFDFTKDETKTDDDHCYRGEAVYQPEGTDLVLIKLDEEVPSAIASPAVPGSPIPLDKEIKVYSYGHHFGLPRSRSGEQSTTLGRCDQEGFFTTLDRFKSGSGSPVFEETGGGLVGLLRHASGDDFSQEDDGCHLVGKFFRDPNQCDDVISLHEHIEAISDVGDEKSPHAGAPRRC